MTSNGGPGNQSNDPNRRPLIIGFALVAVGLTIGSVLLSDLSNIFAVILGILAVVIAVLAWGGENYLQREFQLRRRDAAAAAEEIEKLAWQDKSTGLFSFSWFQQALEREVSRSARYDQACVVIWLTLDYQNFLEQSIHAGNTDQAYIWRFISDLASAAVRDTDSVARRPGEYSMVVLLPQSDAEGGNIVINRLNQRLENEKLELADGTRSDIRFTHKIVSFPTDGSTAQELIKAAQQ